MEAVEKIWLPPVNCGYTGRHVRDAPKWCAGFSENPALMHLLEHPFLLGQQNR
jgi:hypothetical protein